MTTRSPALAASPLADNGSGALVPLALFLGLGLVAWLAPWWPVRLVAVALHGALTLLAMLSVGVFFLPAALVLAAGSVREVLRLTAPPTPAAAPAAPASPA